MGNALKSWGDSVKSMAWGTGGNHLYWPTIQDVVSTSSTQTPSGICLFMLVFFAILSNFPSSIEVMKASFLWKIVAPSFTKIGGKRQVEYQKEYEDAKVISFPSCTGSLFIIPSEGLFLYWALDVPYFINMRTFRLSQVKTQESTKHGAIWTKSETTSSWSTTETKVAGVAISTHGARSRLGSIALYSTTSSAITSDYTLMSSVPLQRLLLAKRWVIRDRSHSVVL